VQRDPECESREGIDENGFLEQVREKGNPQHREQLLPQKQQEPEQPRE
jgi:hypothetical protein